MQEGLSSKEHKWTAALSKLQEQVEIQSSVVETFGRLRIRSGSEINISDPDSKPDSNPVPKPDPKLDPKQICKKESYF